MARNKVHNKSFEEDLARLEEIVAILESGEKTLDENLKLYEHSAHAAHKLDEVEAGQILTSAEFVEPADSADSSDSANIAENANNTDHDYADNKGNGAQGAVKIGSPILNSRKEGNIDESAGFSARVAAIKKSWTSIAVENTYPPIIYQACAIQSGAASACGLFSSKSWKCGGKRNMPIRQLCYRNGACLFLNS